MMDILLNGELSGIDAAEKIQKQYGIPFIFLSGTLDTAHMNRIEKLKHFGFLIKPADIATIEFAVKLATSKIAKEA